MFLASLLLLCVQQEDDAKKARKARLNELRKTLNSGSESDKLSALAELGGIDDNESRSLIVGKLVSGTEGVRIAAAKAIVKHRRPSSANSIGAAVDSNTGSEAVMNAFVEALSELDVCRSIVVLLAMLRWNNYALQEPILAAVAKIGCPEAAQGLLGHLAAAEKEEKKPDFFEDVGDPLGGEGTGPIENKSKNKTLAALADPLRAALAQVTGKALGSGREYNAWLGGGERGFKLTAVYLCEATGQTFDVPAGKPKKCPNDDGKSGHADTLLKHRRE